jgi:hypothetical protein
MGTPNKYRPEMCEIARKVLADGEDLSAVCDEIGISRSTLYAWRDSHPDFKEAIECGLQTAQRVWVKIGRDGVIGNCEKFSAPAWIFTMKNRFREDYAENKDTSNDKKAIIADLLDKLID